MIATIVPVWNGGAFLPRCIDALIDAGVSPDTLVIVDDGSTDGVASAVASRSGAHIMRVAEGPAGPAHARNLGAEVLADADILLFVDADVVVHPDAVKRFVDEFDAEPDVVAIFGSYDDHPDAPGLISRYKNLVHHFTHQRGRRRSSTFWSGCGAVRREAFIAVGGFDTRFRGASIEDIDLGLRLTDAGYSVSLHPEIQCTHLKRWGLRSWLRTDIFARAVPWTRLLSARGGRIPDDLNLGVRERTSAVFVLAGTVALPLVAVAALRPAAWLVALVSLACFVTLQRHLITFFIRHMGTLSGLGAIALHWIYFLYSSVTFVLVTLQSRLRSESLVVTDAGTRR